MSTRLISDIRHTMRRWRRRPAFTITSVITLALGIGATTAIFSVIDAVLLQPLPWPEPHRLVAIHAVEPERLQRPAQAANWDRATLGWREWEALAGTGAFAHVATWQPAQFLYTADTGPELLDGLYVSSNLLETLGVRPMLGRMFTAGEDRAVHTQVAMISYENWQRRFGGQDVLDRSALIGLGTADRGSPRRIVGVLPPRFRFQGQAPEFLLPIGEMSHNLSFETNRPLRLTARLAPDVSVAAAQGAVAPLVRATETSAQRSARVVRLADEDIGQAARPLWLLLGGAALLLLVACANFAGLLIGEARARSHEIAVRTSLGGSFVRILRELSVEHALLSMVAAAAGVGLAIWLTPLLVALAPDRLPRLDLVRIDLRIAGLALGLGLVTSMLFALAPAMVLARTPAARVLAEGSRDGTSRRNVGQRLVVAAEIALALVLVVGASLFGETIARLTAQPLGFEAERLVVVSASAAARPYTAAEWQSIIDMRNDPNRPTAVAPRSPSGVVMTAANRMSIIAEWERERVRRDMNRTTGILDRLAALPGVIAVAGATPAPFVGTPPDVRVRQPQQPASDAILVSRTYVTEQYFRAMGLPIVKGRGFDATDVVGALRLVVSRELERRVFDGQAVGRTAVFGTPGATPAAPRLYDVVGVAEDARQRDYVEEIRPAVYILDRAGTTIGNTVVGQYVIRTASGPESLLPLIRDTLRSADPPMAITSSRTMEDLVATTVAEPRFRALLAAVFGLAALLLAAVGLYALASRRVEERRREIGVRVALGARARDVRRLVLGDTMRTLAIGLGLGLPAAYAASQITQSLLFGVSPTAPHVFAIAAAVLSGAAALAALVAARRATSVDPMIALKH